MQQFKKIGLVLVVFLVLGACLVPLASAEGVVVEGDAYTQVDSMYLWRGQNLSPDSDYLVEAGVDLFIGNFSLGVWSIYDEFADDVVETDWWIDYTFALTETLSLTVGDAYYTYNGDLDDATGEEFLPDNHEAYLIASFDTLLAPTFSIYWDWSEANGDGLFYTAAISHAFELSDALALNLGAEIGYNQESDYMIGDYSDWHHGEVNASLDWSVNDNIIVTPKVRVSTALSDAAEDANVSWVPLEDETAVSLGVTYVF